MNDLISRSALIKHFEAVQQQEHVVGLEFVAAIDEIKGQPTAYDVDKVIEELETNQQNALEVEESIKEYNVWNDAIEIVKQGGVSDDISNECEWIKYLGSSLFETSCGNMSGIYRGYAFCPFCGKKIKMVK